MTKSFSNESKSNFRFQWDQNNDFNLDFGGMDTKEKNLQESKLKFIISHTRNTLTEKMKVILYELFWIVFFL